MRNENKSDELRVNALTVESAMRPPCSGSHDSGAQRISATGAFSRAIDAAAISYPAAPRPATHSIPGVKLARNQRFEIGDPSAERVKHGSAVRL
jgi:hypothetical protein